MTVECDEARGILRREAMRTEPFIKTTSVAGATIVAVEILASMSARVLPEKRRLTEPSRSIILYHVVEHAGTSLNRVFHALADPTRRAMLRALTPGERTVGELGAPFEMTFAAASKHIKVLEGAGLVERQIRGRSHFCRLQAVPLAAADKWLRFYERYWTDRLDRLEKHFTPHGEKTK